MFGLFKKKNKPTAEPPESTADEAPASSAPSGAGASLVAEWDGVIADIRSRFQTVVDQAMSQSQPLIQAIDGDFGPLTRVWSVVEAKMHEATEQVSDGWDEISDKLSDLDDVTDEMMDTEGTKRDTATCEIEISYNRGMRQAMADAAQALYERAKATAGEQGTNLLRMFSASGARFIGDWKAHGAWETMVRANTAIDQFRDAKDVPLELLQRFEKAAQEYWNTCLGTEAELVPEQQQYLAAKIERYMKDASKKLRQHWQWRDFEKQRGTNPST